jgi:hypothetical protein
MPWYLKNMQNMTRHYGKCRFLAGQFIELQKLNRQPAGMPYFAQTINISGFIQNICYFCGCNNTKRSENAITSWPVFEIHPI